MEKTIEQDIENEEKHQNDCCSGEHNHDDCNCHKEKVNNDHDHSKYVQDELKKEKKTKKKVKKDEKTELKQQIKDLEEKFLRAQAELINYRKRKDEEVVKLLKYSNEDLVKGILPLLDNFERAIKMDDENLEDEVSKFLAGFKMIYVDFKNTMEKFEVIAIDGNNKPFDPTYHQAVMTDKVEGVEPGMVVEVLQKGYLLKDRVIRPAMVRVSE